MDGFGNKILQLGAIVKISETMIKRILARQTLQADEFVKFQVFLTKYFYQTEIFLYSGRSDVVQN